MARTWRRRTAATLLGLVVALLIAELGLRTARGAPDPCVFPSRYGTIGEHSWLHDFEIDPHADSVSIRDQIVPVEEPPGEVRVLFVGDSGTAGTCVQPREAYPKQVALRLDLAYPDNTVRVINAGALGMTTVGEYYLLRDELLALDPDHVVIGLYLGNDINFNLGHREWKQARAPGLVPWLARRSALFSALRQTVLEVTVPVEPWRVPRGVPRTLIDENGLHMLSYPGGELATYMKPQSGLIDRAYELLRSTLRAFVDLGKQHGFSVAVVLVPTPSSVEGHLLQPKFPDMLDELADEGIALEESDLDVGMPTRRVETLCTALEIPCIDPTERMREEEAPVFFPDDPHPTVAGHRCLAEELLARSDEWLPDLEPSPGVGR